MSAHKQLNINKIIKYLFFLDFMIVYNLNKQVLYKFNSVLLLYNLYDLYLSDVQ